MCVVGVDCGQKACPQPKPFHSVTTRRAVEAATIQAVAHLPDCGGLTGLWAAHQTGLVPLDALLEGCDAGALARLVSSGVSAPPHSDTHAAAARTLAAMVAAVHAPASGPAGPRRAAAAARVLARVVGDAAELTTAVVAHCTPRSAGGAWAAAQATAAIKAGDVATAGDVVAAAAGVLPTAAADTLLPHLITAGAVDAAGRVASAANPAHAGRVAVDAASPSASVGTLAAAAAVVATAAPGSAAAFLAAGRGVDRRKAEDAAVAALAAWLVQGEGGEEEEEEEEENQASSATPLFNALAAATDAASASAATDALLQTHAPLPATATLTAASTAWAQTTRGGRWTDARWVARLVAAMDDRDCARRACEARLLTSADAGAVAGAAAWALCEEGGWVGGVLSRVPRCGRKGRVTPDAAVAAAVAVATTAHALHMPIPAPATDLLVWAASGRAPSRAAVDVAAATLRAIRTAAATIRTPDSASTWTLEARAAAVAGWDASAGRAPLSAGGLGGGAAAVLDSVRQRVRSTVTPTNAGAVARCLAPLVVAQGRSSGGGAGGAALCASLI